MKRTIVALAFIPLLAHAITGNELYSQMEKGDPVAIALSYVRGFIDAGSVLSWAANPLSKDETLRQLMFCVPKGASGFQAYDVFKKYLTEHPAQRHLDASPLAFLAFSQAWPCSRYE